MLITTGRINNSKVILMILIFIILYLLLLHQFLSNIIQCNMGPFGAYLIIAYSGSPVVWYYIFGKHNSVGNNSGWSAMLKASI